ATGPGPPLRPRPNGPRHRGPPTAPATARRRVPARRGGAASGPATPDHDAWLKEYVRDIPDFPRPGVVFKDITPLLSDVKAFRYTVDTLCDHFADHTVDKVLGIEARGFIIGAPVPYRSAPGS